MKMAMRSGRVSVRQEGGRIFWLQDQPDPGVSTGSLSGPEVPGLHWAWSIQGKEHTLSTLRRQN